MGADQGRNQGFGPMAAVRSRRAPRPALSALAVLVVLGLAGCGMDRETGVRAQLDDWVFLGDTVFFKSTPGCTAGLFEAKGVKSSVAKVQGIDRGLRLIGQGTTVAFDLADMSPAATQEAIDGIDRSVGLAILASGLAARDCFTDELKQAFSNALHAEDVVLLFGPDNHAVALFDRSGKRVFYTRGKS